MLAIKGRLNLSQSLKP